MAKRSCGGCGSKIVSFDCNCSDGQKIGCGCLVNSENGNATAWCECNGNITITIVAAKIGDSDEIKTFSSVSLAEVSKLDLPKIKATSKVEFRAENMKLGVLATLLDRLVRGGICVPVSKADKKIKLTKSGTIDEIVKALGLTTQK